jgi:predicted MFS family arabinose efflux permease
MLAERGTPVGEVAGESRVSPSARFRRYIVFMLVVVTVVSYVDRQLLTILLEPIRHDLKFTDTQMGLLTGTFFSAFYVVSGIPLARLSDVGSRRTIIAVCMAAYGLATGVCGLVQSFWQFASARMFVALGEGGSVPAGSSLIADIFPPSQRVRIFSLISCGSAIGIALGIYLGGVLNEFLGWRKVFVVIGVPSFLIAVLFYFSVPEPVRPAVFVGEDRLSVTQAMLTFMRLPTYWAIVLVAIFGGSTAYAIFSWMPTFLIRVHGMSTRDVGIRLSATIVLGLLTGNLTTGMLTHWLGAKDVRWLAWIPAAGLLCCVPLGVLSFFSSSATEALIFFGILMVMLGFYTPPLYTIAVGLVDTRSRALASSTIPIYFSIGGALGPFLVGFMNDALTPAYGIRAIRYSLTGVLAGFVVGAIAALAAAHFIRGEYRSGELTVEALHR